MKIYILTCINENSELVSAKAYYDLLVAQSLMRKEWTVECSDFESNGRLGYHELRDRSASCGNEEYGYIWNITEAEL